MVGKRIAIFAAAEAKTTTGRLTTEQKTFIAVVQKDGGIAGDFRSLADSLQLFDVLEVGMDENPGGLPITP